MSNFLRKLKKKQLVDDSSENEEKSVGGALGESGPQSLDLDMYRTDFEFIIISQMPGVSSDSLEISLEGDNDVVVIKAIPSSSVNISDLSFGIHSGGKKGKAKELMQECNWNNYFRRIPLPKEVKSEGIDAKIKRGVLILRLPFSATKVDKGKKVIMAKDEE